jgi:hypothetical protein
VPVGVPPVPVTVAVNVTDWPTVEGFTEEVSAVVLAFVLTTCVTTVDVLVAKFESPEYFAVIECDPTASVDVANVATPELSVPVPSVVAPSRNVTVPVGVPPVPVTVAVNVTDWPAVEGLTEEVSVVVLAFVFTTWVTTEDVLAAKLESPPYCAVIEWEPRASVDVENDAAPPLSVPVPSVVAPSRNVTVPVGIPPVPVTVAVNVTGWPIVEGLTEEPSTVVVALRLFTTCVTTDDVLMAKFESPEYFAVIECDPTARVVVANVATPELSVPVPSVVTPSRNVTVPVGVPPVPDTVAVNVTDWPIVEGLREDVRTVVLALPFTTCVTTEDVLAAKLESPP